MRIEPTISMERGDAFVSQCNYCGLLVCVPGSATGHRRLAGCPSCDKQSWSRQSLPVGPFKKDLDNPTTGGK
jgi:uncharacterized paraquat-inducible protein A